MNSKLVEFNQKLKNSKIAIIGLGVSNIPLLDYLYELKCNVEIFSDVKIEVDTSKYGYKIHEDGLKDLVGFDIIFRSPGCLPTRSEIAREKERGALVTTEVEQVIKLTPAKVIGITGSDGKTTTTTLINLVLEASGYKTFLGGNIGTPLFTKIKDMTKDDIVVLELSSFQLMEMTVSPDISVITNITPNHLDKHKNMDEYIESKCNIYKYPGSLLILNADNEVTKNLTSNREIRYFSRHKKTNSFYTLNNKIYHDDKVILEGKDIHIRGIHNYENICTCLAATYDLIDMDKALKAIKEFSGVEHRLEFVREIDYVKWYNDSVSSSPTRTIAGLNSYDEDIVLIAGGYDKNLDYTPIAKPILKKVTKLILFGSTADKIYNAVISKKKDEKIEIYREQTLDDVVNRAKEVAKPGEIVLFSPASASFDMFKNFADRGIQFKDLVNKL